MSGIPTPFDRVSSSTTGWQALRQNSIGIRAPRLRRPIFFLLVALSSLLGAWIMFDIFRSNGITVLEASLLMLFVITYSWVTFSFCSGVIGFFLQLFKLDPLTLKRQSSTPRPNDPVVTRTAVVMPIYNEDIRRVIAGFEASLHSLQASGQGAMFDFYLLSDTQDPELAKLELKVWNDFTRRIGSLSQHVYYRRREENKNRKVGNLADFCQRWGYQYEGMIVLDADSVMTGECMLSLVHALEANPRSGLIQTVPIPVRGRTFFGRFIQFAAELYSPMLATGLVFWQTDAANYWGHNAIIRISAFVAHCGLPRLSGKGPFGGEILSHDFVEAALLRRAGWDVLLLADLPGSYEEVPSNILDYATRDRRWVQGNIQHLALLNGRGLHGLNRLHFFLGAIAYISSLLWLTMLGLSTADAIVRAVTSNVFFAADYQLFPNWPVAKTQLIFSLLYLTAIMLFLPKIMGTVIALIHRRAAFGGTIRLTLGTLVETFFAVLVAPLMMVFHAYFVVCVLCGVSVNWNGQVREGRVVPWTETLRHTLIGTLAAIAWGGLTYYFAPTYFWWLVPVLVGLILAAPIVRLSSSVTLGTVAYKLGIFRCESEQLKPAVLTEVEAILESLPKDFADIEDEPRLPPAQWQEMPVQTFSRGPKRV